MNPFSLSGIASLSNAVQAGAQSAASVADYADKKLREKAQTDLLNMSVNLEKNTNDFLNELYQSNDYENWQQKTDDFLQQQNNQLQSSSKNAYTAKMADQMLKQSRNSIQNQVAKASIAKMQEQSNVEDANTIATIKTLPITAQEKLSMANQVIDQAYAQGRQSPQQAYTNKLQNVQQIFTEDLNTKVNTAIDNVIQNGGSYSDIEKIITESPELEVMHDGQKVNIDYSTLKDKAKQTYRSVYNARLNDLQNQNDKKIEQFYSNVFAGNMTNEQLLTACAQGKRMAQQMKGNQLANGRQKFWIDAFSTIEKAAGKSGSSGSSSANLEAFKTFIAASPGTFLEYIKDGTFDNMEEGAAALQAVIKDDFFNGNWKETKDMKTDAEKQAYYTKELSKYASIKLLDSDTLKKVVKEKMPGMETKYEAFLSDYKKDIVKPEKDRKYTADASTYISGLITDLARTTNLSDAQAIKAAEEKVNQAIGLITMNGLETMFSKKSNNKAMLQNTAAFEDNDAVYVDANGNEHWANGTKEIFDKNAMQQKEYLQDKLGITLGAYDTKKVKNDSEPIAQFKDDDGNEYYLQTTRNKKGKADGVEIYRNGQKVSDKELKEIKNNLHSDYKAQATASKQAMKDAKNATVDRTVSLNAAENYHFEDVSGMLPGNVSKSDWDNMSRENKADIISMIDNQKPFEVIKTENGFTIKAK